MSATSARRGVGERERRAETSQAKLSKEKRVRRNAEKRAALKLVSWNVNSFAPRAADVDALFAHEDIDILFVCETKQQRWSSGSVKPLDFDGNVISMMAKAKSSGKRQGMSMGIAFLSKRPGMLRREGAYQCTRNKWQILVVRHADIRIIGVYATPSASATDWRELIGVLKRLRGKGGKLIVCGDLNASHPAWSPSGKTTGGNALQELLVPLQRREPRKPGSSTPGTRLPKTRGKQQRPGLFELRAPRGITHPFLAADGTMVGSTIDLMLIAGWKGKRPPTPTIITSPAACASDHLPIATVIKLGKKSNRRAKEIFLPSPHRRNSEAGDVACKLYRQELPKIASKLRACGSKIAFDAHVEELQQMVRMPWMVTVKEKPPRHTESWSADADRVAKFRSQIVKRALGPAGKAADWLEKRRLDREIKRLVRAKAHLRRQVTADNLRKDASALSLADVAARIQKASAVTDDACKRGDELVPREFTKFFADKPPPASLVPLRKYTLPREMEGIFLNAIRRAKKGKAAGPDGVPMELLQMSPFQFAELLYELFAAGARLRCVMKDWDLSILIPIFKKKGRMAEPSNHRPLRLILIMRKIFEMGTTTRLVKEKPDELEQYGFIARTMAESAAAMVMATASRPHIITILLDLIKAYDLVQRDQVMAIVDEEHSAATAGMVATLLQTSTVMTMDDESQLKLRVNVGLTQGGPASPALYNKTANVLIRRVLHALKIIDDGESPGPLLAFADDVALLLASDVAAAIALRAAGSWAMAALMRFNLGPGKSLELHRSTTQPGRRMIDGEELRVVESDSYLGVGAAAAGATLGPMSARVDGASATLATLKQTGALVRGMDLGVALSMYKTFLRSKWLYGCFFTPITTTLQRKLDGLDAGFISTVLTAVSLKSTRATLPVARALLRIDSPALAQKIRANQFVAQLVSTSSDDALPLHIRERARRARVQLPAVPHLSRLVPDLDRPWQPRDMRAAREEEWERAFAGRKRTAPPVGRGQAKLPWGLTLLPPWTRPLVARYFLGSFPIIERWEEVGGKRKYAAVAKSQAEKRALRILRILHRAGRDGEEGREDVEEAREAFEVLRWRGSRGRCWE